jgi:hypothetical protein
MSPQDKSLWLKAAIAGACLEASTWVLPFWAGRASPAHPEDTVPMFVFGITQIPSILLGFLLIPFMHFIGIPPVTSIIVSSGVTSVVQGFLFAVLAYVLLYGREKKAN